MYVQGYFSAIALVYAHRIYGRTRQGLSHLSHVMNTTTKNVIELDYAFHMHHSTLHGIAMVKFILSH